MLVLSRSGKLVSFFHRVFIEAGVRKHGVEEFTKRMQVSLIKEDNMVLRNARKKLADNKRIFVLSVRKRCMKIRYSLRSETHDGVTFYGIEVDSLSDDGGTHEHVYLPELTSDRALAVRILRAMHRGAVTVCSAAGVADDMLCEAVMEKTER